MRAARLRDAGVLFDVRRPDRQHGVVPGAPAREPGSQALALLPGGKARAEKLTTLTVGEGATKQDVTAWAITGISNSPIPVWADANNKFFGFDFFLSWLPDAYAGEHAATHRGADQGAGRAGAGAAEGAAQDAGGPGGLHATCSCSTPTRSSSSPIRPWSSTRASSPPWARRSPCSVPPGAQVIDGRGKTLVPGLWDCHMHVGNDFTGVQELSMGVTSVRDPGNDDSLTIDRRKRVAQRRAADAERVSVVAHRRQGTVHRAGGECRDQRGRS